MEKNAHKEEAEEEERELGMNESGGCYTYSDHSSRSVCMSYKQTYAGSGRWEQYSGEIISPNGHSRYCSKIKIKKTSL